MAEANWAAFECPQGNYHIPPWVYVVVTDDDDRIVPGPDATGLLAFFDPVGGGELIPPFFQTTDHVRLVNGGSQHDPAYVGRGDPAYVGRGDPACVGRGDPALACPCGYDSAYIVGGIQRVDLVEEAGCAAQV